MHEPSHQFHILISESVKHISGVKYVLPADRVMSKWPDYQSFGMQSKLRIDPKDIPN